MFAEIAVKWTMMGVGVSNTFSNITGTFLEVFIILVYYASNGKGHTVLFGVEPQNSTMQTVKRTMINWTTTSFCTIFVNYYHSLSLSK